MSSTFNLSAKGWFAIGMTVCVLAAFAFSTAGIAFDSTPLHLVRYKTWLADGPIEFFIVCALIWHSVAQLRIARATTPARKTFIQNPS